MLGLAQTLIIAVVAVAGAAAAPADLIPSYTIHLIDDNTPGKHLIHGESLRREIATCHDVSKQTLDFVSDPKNGVCSGYSVSTKGDSTCLFDTESHKGDPETFKQVCQADLDAAYTTYTYVDMTQVRMYGPKNQLLFTCDDARKDEVYPYFQANLDLCKDWNPSSDGSVVCIHDPSKSLEDKQKLKDAKKAFINACKAAEGQFTYHQDA
ncbi:uncharacterized protein PFL1_00634 [Pseudozyma flocculosa PF-1]|uniref:Uncharacterized protein n=1 Tax=Pseudozyma flocculosa TaxID=84751 RepID=A0A5C3EQU9_9BASI|nr:uncharacterized protein PFL1_00634 [Pseudozyma flocculosa PF-1]EPQ32438.1 hypothetical protein PFL1_00634 [Pseudozyma flocculosa PF-1]SPO34578.1 uncharacterized protein PSFLO_00049 [Pseudozyma flocculosa]